MKVVKAEIVIIAALLGAWNLEIPFDTTRSE